MNNRERPYHSHPTFDGNMSSTLADGDDNDDDVVVDVYE
jgi:hypothetical protein